MFSDVPKLQKTVKEFQRTIEALKIYFPDELGHLNMSNTTDVDVKVRALRVQFEGITKLNRTFEMCNKESRESHERVPSQIKESLQARGVAPLDLSTENLEKTSAQLASISKDLLHAHGEIVRESEGKKEAQRQAAKQEGEIKILNTEARENKVELNECKENVHLYDKDKALCELRLQQLKENCKGSKIFPWNWYG